MGIYQQKSKVLFPLVVLILLFGNTAYAAKFKSVLKITPFVEEQISFRPDDYKNGAWKDGDVIRLGNGRIALKKIVLPKLKRDVQLNATVTLTSNGDAWDKTGSCFIIPAKSLVNMLTVADGSKAYPEPESNYTENLKGVIPGTDYFPSIEIMRFMTPFGVGHFSGSKDSVVMERTKPVYIDEWAPNVTWTDDVSDLYPLLTEEVYVGVFIDTWTKEGYKVSVELDLQESVVKQDKLVKQTIYPLVNTVYYQGQDLPDIFSRQDLTVPFNLPKNAKNVRLKYIVTGHGGLSGGDEFVPNENILSLDGTILHQFTPWRTDCASFRRFNPSTGTWLTKRETAYISKEGRATKVIDEIIASSDLSRSNWCPGSMVEPLVLPLEGIEPGQHLLKISIPTAQSADKGMNHWLVSAYLVWEN